MEAAVDPGQKVERGTSFVASEALLASHTVANVDLHSLTSFFNTALDLQPQTIRLFSHYHVPGAASRRPRSNPYGPGAQPGSLARENPHPEVDMP